MSPEARQQVLRSFGLDQPWPVQYVLWIWNMLHGNMGISYRSGQPVAGLLISRLPLTVELALLSVVVGSLIGIPLGIAASVSRGRRPRVLAQFFGVLGLSVPHFWVAVVLIIVASFVFHWLPPMIFAKPWENPVANLQQMFLPVVAISLGLAAEVMRMTRSSMMEVLGEEYVRTARAKGLAERRVVVRHALRNALIPIVTILGLELGYLLGGVVIAEQIFGMPGLGWTLLNGVQNRDYPVVQGAIMLFAVTFAMMNLLVDVLYTYLDPRIRY
jgi:peptide/nickel transport system permease protein